MSPSSAEDQDELRRVVRRFLEERSTSADVRRLMAAPERDQSVWGQMAEQLGLQGIAIPEEQGGAGFGPVELGIVLEEMGRVLLVAPFLATVVLGGHTLATSGDAEAQARWLPGIADGTLTATLAVAEEAGTWDLDTVAATATQADDGVTWTLSGTKHHVLDGHTADLLLVVAQAPTGPAVFAVAGDAPGVERQVLETLDPTRDLALLTLQDAPAVRVGAARDTAAWLAEVRDLTLAALASEQIGGAARCLEIAVEHAKTREQFGRPIGSFQAVKHRCALLLLDVECGRSAVYHANGALASGDAEAPLAAAVAQAAASAAFTRAAKDCIQVLGGIGYTWEHDAHLFLRRAKSSELMLGPVRAQRARLADLMGV